ncbi:Hippocalcin-like protein 1 [Mactra antiquata]
MGGKSSKCGKLHPRTLQELRHDVNLSTEEIQNWYAEYQSSLASDKTELTREEFKKVYNSLFVGDASAFAEHIFRTFDRDGNGTVNFREFLIGLCVSGNDENSGSKLRWAFEMYDINGDGYISRKEMNEIVEAIYKMTNAYRDRDTSRKMSEKLFHLCDLNDDGKISFEEFCKGVERDPAIVNLLQCDPTPDN